MGVDMPVAAIRGQIASAIDIIVHLGRLPDGSRKLMEIVEVEGMDQQEIQIHSVFARREDGELIQTGEIKDQKKLKEYGQYDSYQALMEKWNSGDQLLEA